MLGLVIECKAAKTSASWCSIVGWSASNLSLNLLCPCTVTPTILLEMEVVIGLPMTSERYGQKSCWLFLGDWRQASNLPSFLFHFYPLWMSWGPLVKCDIHTVRARNKPLSLEAIKSFRGGHSSSTPDYLNIYFLGPHACWGCPEPRGCLAYLNPSSLVCCIHHLHTTAPDKVQELRGLVTSSPWPQLSSTLALSSKLHSDQGYFGYHKEPCLILLELCTSCSLA